MRPGTILVIGYGNELRGDDAAGPRAARAVAAWGVPHVQVLAVHQLTPELADPLALACRALFLDAHAASEGASVLIRPLAPEAPTPQIGHTLDPHALLALAQSAFGRAPEAWWITIPAVDFALGAKLSPAAERGVADALVAIRPLLDLRTSRNEATIP